MTRDYAILVGIGKYADTLTFPDLEGPANDVALMKEWLISPKGGRVKPENIVSLLSPSNIPPETDPDNIPPITEDFKRAFKKLVCDKSGRFINRTGRLYLYFSGHGFCEKKSLTPQATLYAANATREFPENIFGSYYALIARDKALFSEIVLIMDCCRDAEVNRPPDIPVINESGNSAANNVKLFCIYAAPKGGKALERLFAERSGMVCGLLTHALLRAFDEARPDMGTFITGAALKRHMLESWSTVCGDTPAPQPEIVLPTGTDLQFRSRNLGVLQKFEFSVSPTISIHMEIFDGQGQLVVCCDLNSLPDASSATWSDGSSENLNFDGKVFSIRLQPSYYKYVLSGGLNHSALFAVLVSGGSNVQL